MKKTLCLVLLIAGIFNFMATAQVTWSFNIVGDKTEHPAVEITANIARGYHLYAADNPEGGMPLEFYFDLKGCKLSGSVTADTKYTVAYNDIFESDEHYYTGTVKFLQKLTPESENFSVAAEVKGQVCDDKGCVQVGDSHKLTGKAIVPKAEDKTYKK